MQKRKNKINKWDVFFNKKRKHPSITYGIKGDDWINYDITHKRDKNHRYEMVKNPNTKDKRKSFLSRKANFDDKQHIGKKYKTYKVSNEDKKNISKFYKNKKR